MTLQERCVFGLWGIFGEWDGESRSRARESPVNMENSLRKARSVFIKHLLGAQLPERGASPSRKAAGGGAGDRSAEGNRRKGRARGVLRRLSQACGA